MTLYHCSPTPGLRVLKPSVTQYFGKPRQVCLTASLPMALMYGVKHFEYAYGYTGAGRVNYEEYLLGEKRRRWVVRAEADTIQEKGLLTRPGDPFARYLREKYPESWALAAREAMEEQAEHKGGTP